MTTARICIVSPEFIGPFPNGGVGTACYWEALTLGAAGFDVTVLYTGPTERQTPEHWEAYFGAHAPFRYVDITRHSTAADVEQLARFDHVCAETRTSELVLAWLRRQRFDLVMFQEFLGHGARALQAWRSGDALERTRTATTMHSCRQWIFEGMKRMPGGPQDIVVDFLEKESARLADRAIAPSRHMADWTSTHWRLSERPAVLPYCYDQALAQRPGVVEHHGPFRHLVFFGRLETRKGLHLFCRALLNDQVRAQVDRVTFLGKQSSVEGVPSEAFIAAQMAQHPGLGWAIKGDLDSFEAQAWLAEQPGILVVAPSLVDNLPYAVIELHTRRIPYISTAIGGIPEIAGPANGHLLAAPTELALAAAITRVCNDGRLTVDYRSGYDVAAANATHVAFVRELLAAPLTGSATAAPAVPPFDVVVVNAADEPELVRVRMRAGAADRDMLAGRWLDFDRWRSELPARPALFMDARATPEAGCASRLMIALAQPGVDAATSYFVRDDGDGQTAVIAPLGASLETGWRDNAFGGPCLAVNPTGFTAVALATVDGAFAAWPTYAAIVCRGLAMAMVPAPLYTVTADAVKTGGHGELEAVFRQFSGHLPAALDLGWLLKSVFDGKTREGDIGRGLYDHFLDLSDEMLCAYAGLIPDASGDPFIRDFASVRARLSATVARWRDTEPRVFVYGVGQHARMMLAICPELGPFVAGFIDRRPMPSFLGKPCVTPDQFQSAMADAIVYSSREFEDSMYARMQALPVEHVLLYHESPAAPEASTAVRLQSRFGHAAANLALLRTVYRLPKWVAGNVSGSDAAFLAEMVAAHQPRTVVELGVASGASSAALLHALDQLSDPQARELYSCDVRATCYFDDTYETGQACREMYPAPRARWHREWSMDARRLRRTLPAASVDLTFIDANHSHPLPLLDLLQATSFARPGSWVILHDIDLPVRHPQYQVYGPRWLYQAWPFNKVKGFGQWSSIGAVQLPDDASALLPMALELINKPWEQSPSLEDGDLPRQFAAVGATLFERLGGRPALVGK